MMDWWGLVRLALEAAGLAVALAALSVASYEARLESHKLAGLRRQVDQAGFQVPFNLGLTLFCVGLLLGAQPWWEKVILGVFVVLFGGLAIWTWRAPERKLRRSASQLSASRGRGHPSRGGPWLGWILLLAGLLLMLGLGLVTGVQLQARVRSARAHLQALEAVLNSGTALADPGQLADAGQQLSGLHADLEAIESRTAILLPAGHLLGWVPRYGPDLAAAPDLLTTAAGAVSAGDWAFQALSPALDVLSNVQGDPHRGLLMGEQLLPVLLAAQPALQTAQAELAVALRARARVDPTRLSPQVQSWVRRLDRTLPLLDVAVKAALAGPWLLGADGPRTYLILAQNNDELRPTGGFISGVGELRVDGGRLASLTFSDSYAVDNPNVDHEITPPDFQHTLFGQLWFFRDANWDPDFPTSARRALEIYARDRGVAGDGVIALDLSALQLLVDAIGPIRLEGTDEPVTGEYVREVVRAAWSEPAGGSGGEWWRHRKDFMGQIATATMAQLVAGEYVQPFKALKAVRTALGEKHILVSLRDPLAAEAVHDLGWDGALPSGPTPSDRLMVVDTNVGFNKVDPNVERSIHYQVNLGAQGGPEAQLAITYANRSARPAEVCVQESRYGDTYADIMERCYWDYLRVYVPAGSRLLVEPELAWPAGSLLARSGAPIPQAPITTTVPGGYAVWTGFFDLAPGAERTMVFDYQLPADVLQRLPDGTVRYRLEVQKQPGTEAVPLEVDLVVPADADLLQATPNRSGGPTASTLLRGDRQFEVVYRERR